MSSEAKLPAHLRKYVVEQDYGRYTPQDQAVWRFILRQLREFLSVHAHPCYRDGLQRTGISIDEIPQIKKVDEMLGEFGWGAVPVSGFIPPAAFMEFQSLGILPIASDMRSLDHLLYTPAPDIVHEAAGHAPILVHPEFAAYLRKYADVARHAIISKEDMDQYNAIRELSDIKEDPSSTPGDIKKTEKRLEDVNQSMKYVSEAALLSRMNWWTAEYGLIGDLKNPRIYGAGLLSSVGESRECLSERVKKLPLDIHCIDFSYDITEPQPQLFVVPDFQALHEILEKLAERLAFRRGGLYGLEQAKKAETVNSVELNSGVQISGVLEFFRLNDKKEPVFLRFSGPSQLSVKNHELPNQGRSRHPHGFSSPLGRLKGSGKGLSDLSEAEMTKLGLQPGKSVRLEYESGIVLEGTIQSIVREKSRVQVLTFRPCKVTYLSELLFDPAWGDFDLAVGENVVSVFAGAADRGAYGDTEDFAAKRVPQKKLSAEALARNEFFQKVRICRAQHKAEDWVSLTDQFFQKKEWPWLMGMELLELGYAFHKQSDPLLRRLEERLAPSGFTDPNIRQSITDGLKIAHHLQ